MRIDIDVARLYRYWPEFRNLVDLEIWEKRVSTLAAQYQRNFFLRDHIRESHALELAFLKYVTEPGSDGKSLNIMRDPELQMLMSFAAMIVQVHRSVPTPAKRKLEGQIRSALGSDDGFSSLLFEMNVLARLCRQKYRVHFNDLIKGGFEFLATKRAAEIEIECKTISVNAGRKIHRKVFVDFAGRAMPIMNDWQENGDGGIFINIKIPDRLERSEHIQRGLIDHVARAVATENTVETPGLCIVTSERFDANDLLVRATDESNDEEVVLRRAVEKLGRATNSNIAGGWRRSTGAGIILMMESEKPDDLMGAFLERLKKRACEQFTGTRPACIFASPLGLSADELRSLYEADNAGTHRSFNQLAHTLFERRIFLHTVVFMARDGIRKSEVGSSTHSADGHVGYSFVNKGHPMATDPRYTGIVQ